MAIKKRNSKHSPNGSRRHNDASQPKAANTDIRTYSIPDTRLEHPDLSVRQSIENDKDGAEQALGLFDELRTFNYPMTAAQIQAEYNFDSDGDGVIDLQDIQSNDPTLWRLTITIDAPPKNATVY